MVENKIVIYGAGGFGREVAWLAQSSIIEGKSAEVACFVDDDERVMGKVFNNIQVLSLFQAKEKFPDASVVSGVGVPKIRELTIEKARNAGFGFMTLVHPRVEMSNWIEVGEGTVICAGNILTTNIVLGKHVQINLDCTIGHDVVMGDYATLAPGVHISGCVNIGKRVYIGTGANIINGTSDNPLVVGDDAVIGAGACVTKSVPPGQTWGGVPARPLKWGHDCGACSDSSHCSIYSVSTIDNKEGKVVLKKNCRIGSHSVVMPGVTIGENSVIGAFSFVNRDIPANVTAAGVPAKIIKNNP